MPLYVCNGEDVVETFALLDGGANRHVVSKDICRKLNLHGTRPTPISRVQDKNN